MNTRRIGRPEIMLKPNADKRYFLLKSFIVRMSKDRSLSKDQKNRMIDNAFKSYGYHVLPEYYRLCLSELKDVLIH